MKWIKKGRIFHPTAQFDWMQKYGILPTPVYLKELNTIRIYFATSGHDSIGRITYMDVDANNPSQILDEPTEVILFEGSPGTFDDCGVNVSSYVKYNNIEYLFYVGYERSYKVPYKLFPGCATRSNQDQFKRVKPVPIIDRSAAYPFSMAAPYVLVDEGVFKMWLWVGNSWTKVNGKDYIKASIGYAESENGIDWKIIKDDCISINPDEEFSVGRPWVIKKQGTYLMYYSVRYINKLYRLGYAESADGLTWNRMDNKMEIDVSDSGWDSEMICYPAVITTNEKTFLFYNGNQNGISGFGYAELN